MSDDDRYWFDVIRPNAEVRNGEFRMAEFAANLSEVVTGESKRSEYQDATEFFRRTYITTGMKRLLAEAINRLVNGNGEPVLELKTSFGGGKTHSMMALYHLFNRKYKVAELDENVRALLIDAKIGEVPEDVRITALVGTDINTKRATEIPELAGVQTHTLMGEICVQLARAANRFDLYEKHIRQNEESGVSPGTSDLRKFLDGCGRCLILLDELAAYGMKLYENENRVPFDRFIVFLQELTEAVQASDRSMLVVTLPQSEIELGMTEGGRQVLDTIEHRIGRLHEVWSPVEAQESFEIVRRRLFEPCRMETTRDKICKEFAEMYAKKNAPFPLATKEARYAARLKACYPIHPQVFDLLYGKWATIEKFQRTRGVLRLMAAVIHNLWKRHDPNPMIMAGSLPIDEPDVKKEILRVLDKSWESIIDSEIDGEDSKPRKIDRASNKSEEDTARQLTRTIFLGSAPTVRGQNVRGLDRKEIMLGVLTPQNRKDAAKFKDTLGKLTNTLSYLYSDDVRYWFDDRPTLRKLAEDIEARIENKETNYEIIDRLDKKFALRRHFSAKRITMRAEEVPDADCVQAVIFPPELPFERKADGKCEALKRAEYILNFVRDDTPRRHKNLLIFMAGDKSGLESLKKLMRSRMAWKKLSNEREFYNLDQKQLEEVGSKLIELDRQIDSQISATYNYVMVPSTLDFNMKDINWNVKQLSLSEKDAMLTVANYLESIDALIYEHCMNPRVLESRLDAYFFKEEPFVTLGELWGNFASYLYLPRLYGKSVLREAINAGVREGCFGVADDFDEESRRYINLKFGESTKIDSNDQLIVRKDEAAAQLEIAKEIVEDVAPPEEPVEEEFDAAPPVNSMPTMFQLRMDLNASEPTKDIEKLKTEIISMLTLLQNAKISITLSVRTSSGIIKDVYDALKDNGEKLGVKDLRFFD